MSTKEQAVSNDQVKRVDLERLTELLSMATPGPWRSYRASKYWHLRNEAGDYVMEACQRGLVRQQSDSALIVAMYEAMPALLQQLAERDAEVERLKEQKEKFMWQVRDTCTRAEAAEARVRELDLDAARYRFLRDTQTTFGVSAQHDDAGQRIFYVRLHGYGVDPIDVDSAIDAELASEGGGDANLQQPAQEAIK